MAYRADIEIAVKGAQELKRLQDRIRDVSTTVDNFNSKIENIGGGYIVRNINNLTSLLGQAAAEFNKVALGTADATAAARVYVQANDNLNAGLAERVALLKQVKEEERQLKLSQASTRSRGPRIVDTPNAYAGEIGPGPASPVALRSNLGNRVENAVKAQNQAVLDASNNLRIKQSWSKFFRDAATLGTDLQVNAAAQKLNIKTSWAKFFKDAAAPTIATPIKKGAGIGKKAGDALSNAAVGGAFPLLFGQSGSASAGGAIGGALGSAIPGFNAIGGFGGSLIGTIIGDKIGKSSQIKELASDIGFSTEQTKLLTDAFKQAGQEFDKFGLSVQNIRGLSLSIEDQADAINLVSTLTEKYGGQIDKVTNAFTSALESGKVTQATLNQLTSQGVPIQQALADKYKVSRDAILTMAKDGKISTQDLTDTLVDMGNKGVSAVNKPMSGFDHFNKGVKSLMSAIGELASAIVQLLTPAFNWLAKQLAVIINAAAQGIQTVATLLSGGNSQTVVANARARKRLYQETNGQAPMNGRLTVEYTKRLEQLQQEEQKKQLKPTKIGAIEAPGQAPPSGGSKGASAADTAAKAAEREAARVANIVRDRAAEMEIMRMQLIFTEQIAIAEINKDPILKSQLQTTEKINQISINYSKAINDEKAKGNSIRAKEAITKKAVAEIDKVNFEGAVEIARIEINRKENYNNLLMDLDQELKLRSATTEEARNQLRIAYEIAKLKQTNDYKPEQLAAIQDRKTQLAAPQTSYETINLAKGAASDELTKLLDVGNQIVTIGDAIGTSFSNSFKGIINGTMTAREALAGFFQSVADAFLDMAAQIIAKWITMTILNSVLSLFPGGVALAKSGGSGFDMGPLNNVGMDTFNPANSFANLGRRAMGGPVAGGMPYIVGEKGPELFMPGRSGTVIPNNALSGGGTTNVVVNVDATGSNVQGNADQAKKLGSVISAAIQAELIKQRRPGGILA